MKEKIMIKKTRRMTHSTRATLFKITSHSLERSICVIVWVHNLWPGGGVGSVFMGAARMGNTSSK